MTPTDKYNQDLQLPGFTHDAAQAQAMRLIQELYETLMVPLKAESGFFKRWFRSATPVPGLFLHGGVGRGKSYVADSLFTSVPLARKRRVHFHRFMLDVHQQLKKLPQTPDPLRIVAERIASSAQLLVLDEFHVNDVADAMLLVGLLPALQQRQVSMVMTSNYAPQDLYLNGLQRERFLEVIVFIQQHLTVFDFGPGCDYRSQLILREGACHVGAERDHHNLLAREFAHLAAIREAVPQELLVNGRVLPVRGGANGVLWVDFRELCATPRANADYLELAASCHTVLTGWIPVMNRYHDDVVRRFIHMVDIFYDHNVKFIFAAEAEPGALYQGGRLEHSFVRTVSRIREMCSREYLSLPHRAT